MTAYAGRGQALLYLDFDGCLHPDDVWRHPRRGVELGPLAAGHTLFEHAHLLCDILEPHPAIRIVLSTTWVQVLRYSYAVKRLPIQLQLRVVGATYHSSMNRDAFRSVPRGYQVLADVARRKPSAWVALDDDTEGWPKDHLDRLVQSHPTLGLGGPGVAQQLSEQLARISPAAS